MIWVAGQIVPDDALRVSVLDRTFEHGLGLFETLRTWNGVPTLLSRHLDRLQRSADALGLPLAGVMRPDHAAVAALLAAEGRSGDALLRITLSGGTSAEGGATLWLRALDLPRPLERPGAGIDASRPIASLTPLVRFKSLNYWERRLAHEDAIHSGADEILFHTGEAATRLYWEGSRTNLFYVKGGTLCTPPENGPLLPGIMRGLVLQKAGEWGIPLLQQPLSFTDLPLVTECFLTNAVRGIVPVERLLGHSLPAPGVLTARLWGPILRWLESGGESG